MTHTVLQLLALGALLFVVVVLLVLVYTAAERAIAARRTPEQQLRALEQKLQRGGQWVSIPRHHLPADLRELNNLALSHHYRLLGIERARGPVRHSVLVFVSTRDDVASLLFPDRAHDDARETV